MLIWILFAASGLGLLLIFLRRLRLTHQDLRFQKHMAEEEEEDMEEIEEEPEEDGEAPQGSARQLFKKGDTHFSRKEWTDAEGCFLMVLEVDGAHLDAHHKLGMLYLGQEKYPEAELYFNKLVNLKKDPIYFSNLGMALYRQQRLVEAAEAYENAIAMDDKRAGRLQSLAQVYYELGEDEKALKYFELASRRKPKDMELKYILADYYERLERLEEAIAILEKILSADPYNETLQERLKGLRPD